MNSQLKKRIRQAFAAPEPDRQAKAGFLNRLPQPRISMPEFILTQAAYLRKFTIILSVLLLFPALMGACFADPNTLWAVSAFVPFLGLLAVAESTRSAMYGMEEFEMSARFSLKSIVLARMSVLGLLDGALLGGAALLCGIGSNIAFLQTGVYLLVPYLITVNISLWIARHFRSRAAVYACMSVAVLVSTANEMLHMAVDFVYQPAYIGWWFILAVLSAGMMVNEAYHTIKRTEEAAWSW